MTTRIIVLTGEPINAQNRVTSALRYTPDVGWWHGYMGSWIIIDPLGRHPVWWRDHIQTLGLQNFLVLPLPDEGHWIGFGPPEFFSWMYQSFSARS